MISDLWISLTMKIIALGHSLHDAQRMAAVILIEHKLIYTIMGYRLPADEPERSDPETVKEIASILIEIGPPI